MRFIAFCLVLSSAGLVHAQVTTTVDDSATSGRAAAPLPQSAGSGSGFGGMIGQAPGGSPVQLVWDGDVLGEINLAMAGGTCMGQGATYDVGVIYIDAVPGGFIDTSMFTDVSTPEAAAVSGRATTSLASAPLTFDASFQADYAIAFTNPAAGGTPTAFLYTLRAGAPHRVTPLSAVQAGPGLCTRYAIRGLNLSMLGLLPGQSLRWFATLLNATGAFRSNEFQGAMLTPATNIGAASYSMPVGSFNLYASVAPIVINEVDTDQAGSDTQEFIELLGTAGVRLDGLALVTYNGSDDRSYNLGGQTNALDLDGRVLDSGGFFVAGNSSLSPDLTFGNSSMQNGADAVALYIGEGLAFPNDTVLGAGGLVDALVYDTNDADDTALLAGLTPGMPQINEAGGAGSATDSNQRCPNGGATLDTSTYAQHAPSPGAANICATCGDGVLEGMEACDDGAANGSPTSCCAANCSFRAAGTVCALSAGDCDAPDTCDGAGTCDPQVRAAGVVCRAAGGPCDMEESCDGVSATCPTDAFAAAGTACRAAVPGGCDVEETCSGTGAACPADAFAAAGTACRAAVPGGCDVEETCSGGAACPADAFAAAGTVCRAAVPGGCDVEETCSGGAAVCPADAAAPDGTSCADSLVCNGDELCASGTCAAGTALACDDSNDCTADACAEPGGCENTAIAGCCNVDTDCDDGDLCTADSCSGPGGTCTSSAITDCCVADADCDDANLCTADSCDLATHRCLRAPVAGCCTVDSDCDDTNACTTDSCDVATGSCMNAAVSGCCLADGDCDDGDTCTMDRCDAASMSCTNDAIAGCCSADADCDDSDACTLDACDSATAMCTHDADPACASDGGVGDGGVSDGGVGDGGVSDAGDDASVDDGGASDSGASGDGATSDGGSGDDAGLGTMAGGCGCHVAQSTGHAPSLLWLFATGGLLLLRRRRR